MSPIEETEVKRPIKDEFADEHILAVIGVPWFADYANYIVGGSLRRRSLMNGVLSRATKEDLRKIERGYTQKKGCCASVQPSKNIPLNTWLLPNTRRIQPFPKLRLLQILSISSLQILRANPFSQPQIAGEINNLASTISKSQFTILSLTMIISLNTSSLIQFSALLAYDSNSNSHTFIDSIITSKEDICYQKGLKKRYLPAMIPIPFQHRCKDKNSNGKLFTCFPFFSSELLYRRFLLLSKISVMP
ncbi:unnamed protein product [Vicia faba]|uniref:Uncharacterized protein n=1 Tax=Vicia faba TaxID=3906 RepID=A0AAV1A717_VICFA|nr:unnamed protein product [Vicia faba]